MQIPTMIFRLPAPLDEACPKCQSMNTDKKTVVWHVADERGLHGECDVCAHAWKK